MPENFFGVCDLLTERIKVARAKIDKDINHVEGECDEIQGSVQWVQTGWIDCNSHRNEHNRVDGDENDQVRPANTPYVFAWDDVLACLAAFKHLLFLFLFKFIL